MQFVRIYTGDDGESHFEDIEHSYGDDPRGFLITALRRTCAVQFYNIPPGHFSDWHPGDRHQYVITLQGRGCTRWNILPPLTVGSGCCAI